MPRAKLLRIAADQVSQTWRSLGFTRSEWIEIHPPLESNPAKIYGPPREILDDTFKNLFANPVRHLIPLPCATNEECAKKAQAVDVDPIQSPLVIASVFNSTETQTVDIAFVDRASRPSSNALLVSYGGLATARARLQLCGGDMRYFQIGSSTCPPDLAKRIAGLPKLEARHVNCYVLQLPIVLLR